MDPQRIKSYTYLLIVAFLWGIAGPIIKFTLGGIDPLPFLAYRFTIASLFSLFYFSLKGVEIKNPKKSIGIILIYGLLAAPIALGTLFAGLDRSTVLDLTLVGAIGPMVVALGGAVFFKDRITKKEKAGIAIVLLGVFLNSLAPLFRNGSGVVLTGNLLILAFLFADSSSILIAKYAVRHNVKSITLTNFAFIIGAVTLVPTAFLVYGYLGTIEIIMRLPFTYHLGVWYMALVSGSLAYFLYVKAQRSIEVSEAVLFNYLQPVFMIPLAIFWLNETISPSFIFGSVLIIIGIIIAEYKTKSG